MPDAAVKQRILVVEESATLRYMLCKNIQKQGHELVSVDNFEQAIDLLQGELQDYKGQDLHHFL